MFAKLILERLDGIEDLECDHRVDEDDDVLRLFDETGPKTIGGRIASWVSDQDAAGALETRFRANNTKLTELNQRSQQTDADLANAKRRHIDATDLLSAKRAELVNAGEDQEANDLRETVADLAQAEREAAQAADALRMMKKRNLDEQKETERELERMNSERLAKEKMAKASSEDLAAELMPLINAVGEISSHLIMAILPGDETLTPYVLETRERTPINKANFLAELNSAQMEADGSTDKWQHMRLRLSNSKMAQQFAEWMDHLSANRIAEEMDTATYIQRLRDTIQRTKSEAVVFEKQIQSFQELTARASKRLDVCQRLLARLQKMMPNAAVARIRAAHHTDLSNALSKLSESAKSLANGEELVTQITFFLGDAEARVKHLHTSVCSVGNQTAAEELSRSVSREIERKLWTRPWPYLVAFGVFVAVKVAFAFNTNLYLHEWAVPLLTFAPLGGWLGSVIIGRFVRSRRMTELQKHTRLQIADALDIPREQRDALTFKSTEIQQAAKGEGVVVRRPIDFHENRKESRRRAFASNVAMLMVPSVFAATIVVFQERKSAHDFVARYTNAEPCVLATGHAVFATVENYFVRSDAPLKADREWLDYLFPELPAQLVPRKNIVSVIPAGTSNSDQGSPNGSADRLRTCVSSDPELRQFHVTHGGNAVAALGQEETITRLAKEFSNALKAWKIQHSHDGGSEEPTEIQIEARLKPSFFYQTHGNPNIDSETSSEVSSAISDLNATLLASNQTLEDLRTTIDASGEVLAEAEKATVLLLQEQQSQFLASLATFFQDSELFKPTLVLVAPSDDAQSHGDGPIEIEVNNSFTTHVGLSQTDLNLGTLDNTLILPFFFEPMKIDGELTLKYAFDWGRNREFFSDPVIDEDRETTLLDFVAARFSECLEREADAILELDVIGMASRSWIGGTRGYSADELNHALGEGRRVLVLESLLNKIGKGDFRQRVLVQMSDGNSVSLQNFADRFRAEASYEDILSAHGRYLTAEHFAAARGNLFSDRIAPDVDDHPLEELLARSVVLSVKSMEGTACRF